MGYPVKPASMRPALSTIFSFEESNGEKSSKSGSEVAHRLNVDRSAISRAVQRAEKDADPAAAANTILKPIEQ